MRALLLVLLLSVACWSDPFEGRDGCFLLVDLADGKVVEQINPERCKTRLSPCSTFKIAVAAMAYDRGLLTEKTVFKWNGMHYDRKECDQDQTPRTWIVRSVVWVTQRLTTQMGMSVVKKYLDDFGYGNKDMSAGITEAWLTASLEISAEEQVAFLRRLWLSQLGISPEAQANTRKLIRVEKKGSDQLDGKTGSGRLGDKRQLGWFVGHLQHADHHYIFALNFTDRVAGQTKGYAGPEARELTRAHLHELGLWGK